MKIKIFILLILFNTVICFSQENQTIINNHIIHQSFTTNEKFTLNNLQNWFNNQVNDSLFSFKLVSKDKDEFSVDHLKFQEIYNGIDIANAIFVVHLKNDLISHINGTIFFSSPEVISNTISVSDALDKISFKDKILIKYNDDYIEKEIYKNKRIRNLKYVLSNENKLVLCYEIEIVEINSINHSKLYLNIQNGEILKKTNQNHCFAKEIEVNTVLSGKQKIVVDSNAGVFKLLDPTRGLGIETLTLYNQTNLLNASPIIDSTGQWNSLKTEIEKIALDIHFGASATYDYFFNIHKRNSIDNQGYKLKNLIHYGQNFVNAFWDGTQMIFGDGDATTKPLASMDIIGHEITHGMTANTAQLVNENEPGALNESFSDIFGVLIDFYKRPQQANWIVGEEVSSKIRSLENPAINNDPKTYLGKNWKPTGSFGSIHSNNGVQNYWFYLLVNGGSGINDNNDTFNIKGIGIEKASKIIYRNLVYYITPLSDYKDARICSIKATEDIFGSCSDELEAVVNAWYAVGVGNKYSAKIHADFDISYGNGCDSLTVYFKNFSQNAYKFNWLYNNTSFSSDFEPNYTFKEEGDYTIKLIVFGDSICGTKDSITKNQLITIKKTKTIINKTNKSYCSLPYKIVPSEPINGVRNWYDINHNFIDTGKSITYNTLKDTTFNFEDNHKRIGLVNSSKNTSIFNSNTRYLVFDVYKPIILESVEVTTQIAGTRNIELRNSKGVVLQSKQINIPIGTNRIYINFKIDPNNDYQLGLGNGIINLSRSASNVKYPYAINDIISIKRSNASNAAYDYYYFFYDWDIKILDCENVKNEIHLTHLDESLSNTTLDTKNDTIFITDKLTDNIKYQWYNCDKKIIVENQNTFLKTKYTDSYAVILSNQNCELVDTTNCIGIKTNNLKNITNLEKSIVFSPNPTSSRISIFSKIAFTKYKIYNTKGELLEQENFDKEINLSKFENGIYIIVLENDTLIYQEKLIKL
jgi:Zn-dependent metalloprotease